MHLENCWCNRLSVSDFLWKDNIWIACSFHKKVNMRCTSPVDFFKQTPVFIPVGCRSSSFLHYRLIKYCFSEMWRCSKKGKCNMKKKNIAWLKSKEGLSTLNPITFSLFAALWDMRAKKWILRWTIKRKKWIKVNLRELDVITYE